MNVGELIVKLIECNQNSEVFVSIDGAYESVVQVDNTGASIVLLNFQRRTIQNVSV
jgi:hypothetical protein